MLLRGYRDRAETLPELGAHEIAQRVAKGWRTDDPLLHLSGGELARDLGAKQINVRRLRPLLEASVVDLGIAPRWARDAELIDRADGNGTVAWTRC